MYVNKKCTKTDIYIYKDIYNNKNNDKAKETTTKCSSDKANTQPNIFS